MHRDDCAGFLAHLLAMGDAETGLEPVYIGADDLPAPRYEVESWLAAEMGLQIPMDQLTTADDPTRHNMAGHKRCRNRALRGSGYQLTYPDYKSGYRALLAVH
jgi:hypothetical protein